MSKKTLMPGTGLDLDNPNEQAVSDGPVECLGKTFTNDTERREYYLQILAEKLKDPEFRKIEGFPIGEDIDILNLSDPPYYTACPNPFIADFIAHYGRPYDSSEIYKREPYAADVSEGKNDPIYNAHSYHTKVPHKAIMRYILHYTNPGDVVFDGFCGTGMTGVAAQLCGDPVEVQSLGYKVLQNGSVLKKNEDAKSSDEEWIEFSKLGARVALISDLSPIAGFIAYNYNVPVPVLAFRDASSYVIDQLQKDKGWTYKTLHRPSLQDVETSISSNAPDHLLGNVNFTIFSDVFSCPHCGKEVIFWDAAVDFENKKVRDSFSCESCNGSLNKKNLHRVMQSTIDPLTGEISTLTKLTPVLINYEFEGSKYKKSPDKYDYHLIQKSGEISSSWHPSTPIMFKGEAWGDSWRAGYHTGYKNTSDFYTKRELESLATLWDIINSVKDHRVSKALLLAHTAINPYCSKMRRFRPDGKGGGPLAGTLYVSSLITPPNVMKTYARNIAFISTAFEKLQSVEYKTITTTQSATRFQLLPDESLDYIFLDPPFGGNLMYSELNFLWESWLRVWTENSKEAIENNSQKKGKDEYRVIMQKCFEEAYRLLKPGRWMTVEFSNTQASVWTSIQTAISQAGFIVSNVSALDKKQGSYKAVVSPTAVKQDLVISAYKPNGGFEARFISESDEDGVWDFIKTHLGYLPVIKKEVGELLKIPERDSRILFDQVVSYFVRNLRDVPLSSKEFQEGLRERFAERDGMIFLPEQVAQYDKARMTSAQLRQLTIFVDDEASAIEWLRQLLNDKPQTYQDIHPKFIHELSGWKKAEMQLELSLLLEQNFLKFNGQGQVPAQIHSYLSTNFKDLRNLAKDDSVLVQKAKDRWFVPDPNNEEQMQQKREVHLLKEFEIYKNHTGKKLKLIRMEAVRAGFKKAWVDRDYKTIIEVAEKIPEDLLQEDQKLLMWYDQAQTRYSDSSLF